MKGDVIMVKKLAIISSIVCIALMICACGNATQSVKTYTYDDLNESQQKIINNIYAISQDWYYSYEPNAIPATKIKFFYEDSTLVFIAYHEYGGENSGGSFNVYEIDENSGTVSPHTYNSFDEDDIHRRRAVGVQILSGEDFDVDASEELQKNTLARSYGKLLQEE